MEHHEKILRAAHSIEQEFVSKEFTYLEAVQVLQAALGSQLVMIAEQSGDTLQEVTKWALKGLVEITGGLQKVQDIPLN